MGLMDRAKKLAEQAQQKLDEAQDGFNKSASPEHTPDPSAVRYDEHGRPVRDAAPAREGANRNPEPSKPIERQG